MRDSLTVLAILLIGVLTAALVGPYLVDWGAHRALIERELSRAAGTSVTVSGPIDLKLLPKPVFRFGGVTIGDRASGRPRLSADALDAEVSLTGLMRGQVQVVDTTLIHPRLDLVETPDGAFGLPPLSDGSADRIAVDHIGVRDGTIALRLADGRVETLAGLDFDGEATSLRGPFKAVGRAGRVPFRLATGAADGGRLRAKLHLDAADGRPGLDLDGVVARRPGGRGPAFDGSATAAGQVALEGTPAVVPWRMTAHVSADGAAAMASNVELRAGADMRALIADGDGTAAYGAGDAQPRAALQLHGATLDVDSLAVPPDNSGIAPPKGLDVLARLARSGGAGSLPTSPLRLDIGLSVDTATVDGQTSLATTAAVGLGPKPGGSLRLGIDGPAATHLAFDGRFDPGFSPPIAGPFGAAPTAVAATIRGRADVRSADLTRTAAWLAPAAPAFAAWLAATVPGRSVSASGLIEASGSGVSARDLALSIDGSTFAGTASLARAAGTDRARLSADLSSDALTLDRVPDLSGAAAASRDLDLDFALSARAVTVVDPAAAGAPPGFGSIMASHVALHLTKVGDAVRLERLALDVQGAKVDATASGTAAGLQGEARVTAPRFGPLVDVIAPALPVAAAALLRDRAAALSPIDATLRVSADIGRDGTPTPTRLAIDASAGGTHISAVLTPDGPADGRDAASRPVALSLGVDAPEGVDLLHQLGLPASAVRIGVAHVEGTARGSFAAGFATTLAARLGGATLSFAGQARPGSGSGRAALRADDLGSLLAALGTASAGPDDPADATADVGWDGSSATVTQIRARVAGTTAGGDLAFDLARRRPGETRPMLRGRLALDRLAAGSLFGLALGPADVTGKGASWSKSPFAAATMALPRAEVALSIGDVPLMFGLAGRDVALTLRTGPGAVSLADLAGRIDAGHFAGDLTLRRDPSGAALSGRVTWSDIGLDDGALSGRVGGSVDLAGSGASPAALVADLAGTGTLVLSRAFLARTDPLAPARTLARVVDAQSKAELGSAVPEASVADTAAIRHDLEAELDRGPLRIGDAAVATTLAAGVLRSAPIGSSGAAASGMVGRGGSNAGRWTAETGLTLDLGGPVSTSRVALRDATTAAGIGGDVVVSRTGPLGADPPRRVDAADLVQAIQARAIARAQDRIDIFEQDIRERAAFNRQLKAIQADQQAARDRAEADRKAAVARASADAQARADAARAAAAAEKAGVEARRADLARQRADEARVQAEVETAARAEAARDEAERRRLLDRTRKLLDPPPPASIIQDDKAIR